MKVTAVVGGSCVLAVSVSAIAFPTRLSQKSFDRSLQSTLTLTGIDDDCDDEAAACRNNATCTACVSQYTTPVTPLANRTCTASLSYVTSGFPATCNVRVGGALNQFVSCVVDEIADSDDEDDDDSCGYRVRNTTVTATPRPTARTNITARAPRNATLCTYEDSEDDDDTGVSSRNSTRVFNCTQAGPTRVNITSIFAAASRNQDTDDEDDDNDGILDVDDQDDADDIDDDNDGIADDLDDQNDSNDRDNDNDVTPDDQDNNNNNNDNNNGNDDSNNDADDGADDGPGDTRA